MRHLAILAASLLAGAGAAPAASGQAPLLGAGGTASKPRELKGKFLHITDLHPDPFYKHGSEAGHGGVCHGGSGSAGYYGAESTSCDSPFSLINATFEWIAANVADEVDFVVWTGDSARHDNDEAHPRTVQQVSSLNEFAVSKFVEVFGHRHGRAAVPVIPTLGNNDVLPHNVFFPGPNRWTRAYLDVWRPFIPEEQRHGFDSGGWFYVEAIPNHLAVFSLNSLYFFDSNSAVTGCADRDEPGFEQLEWLRVQLQFMRQRGMKAILTGHVPPARTDSKQSWDESCWQKYTLWVHRFRDVVAASVWGHMNTDHFMLHDSRDVDLPALYADNATGTRAEMVGDHMNAQSATGYFTDLRNQWSELPAPPSLAAAKAKKSWAEQYSLSLVGPSVVPNYFPTLRLVSYDVSGIDPASAVPDARTNVPATAADVGDAQFELVDVVLGAGSNKKKHRFKNPKEPSKSTPPGPAHSPQPLTLLGYQQLFANLTRINAQHADGAGAGAFAFELEYDTRDKDDIYGLPDMTVRSYLDLAHRIGRYKAPKHKASESGDVDETGKKKDKKKKKKKKDRKRAERNAPWLAFVRRAFVGARTDDDLHEDFGREFVPASVGADDDDDASDKMEHMDEWRGAALEL